MAINEIYIEILEKIYRVPPPEGWEWVEGNSAFLRRIGDLAHQGRMYGLPECRQYRDVMACAVAEFDRINSITKDQS